MSNRKWIGLAMVLFLAALVFFYWMGGPRPTMPIEEPIAVPDTAKGE